MNRIVRTVYGWLLLIGSNPMMYSLDAVHAKLLYDLPGIPISKKHDEGSGLLDSIAMLITVK